MTLFLIFFNKMWEAIYELRLRVALMVIIVAICVFLTVAPLVSLFTGSITKSNGGGVTFDFDSWVKVFTTHKILKSLLNSVILGLSTATISTVLGITLAWIVSRTNTPFRSYFGVITLIPFFTSPLLSAMSWVLLASPRTGLLNVFMSNLFSFNNPILDIFTLGGMIFVLSLYNTPTAFLLISAALKNMDTSFEESARTCGSDDLETIFRITLPIIAPSILSVFLLNLVFSIGNFSVPMVLGVPKNLYVATSEIYELANIWPPDIKSASVISFAILLITFTALYFQRKIMGKREFTTIRGRGYKPRIIDIGKWKYLSLTVLLLFSIVSVGLPYFAMGVGSLSRYWTGKVNFSMLTLKNFQRMLFQYPMTLRVLKNTLIVGIGGASIGILFCLLISIVIHRTNIKGRKILDFISIIPLGIPGLIFAVGMLRLYVQLPIYGTIWVLVIANLAKYLPQGTRSASSALVQLDAELEESSRVCGASWFQSFTRITIPLVMSGIAAGWILLFVLFFKELSAALLLYSPGNEVFSIAIFDIFEGGNITEALALGLIQISIILLFLFIFQKVTGEKIGARPM